MDWDLLRTFEAVSRLGSLTRAAKSLGISQSTVSRQLAKLEKQAGSPLMLRETPVQPTARGESLLTAIGPMMAGALAAQAALQDDQAVVGPVTLTTVGELARWVLVHQLPAFFEANPGVQLRLLADNAVMSLAAGEADVALRLARPTRGDLIARKVYVERYGYFAAASLPLNSETPWLGLAGSLKHIPEARHAAQTFAHRPATLLVDDIEALCIAVSKGLGVAILPRDFVHRLSCVVEVSVADLGRPDLGPIPEREVWLVVHKSKQYLPQVRAVMDWVVACLSVEGQVPPLTTSQISKVVSGGT